MAGVPVLVGGEWNATEQARLAALLPGADLLFLSDSPSAEDISSCSVLMAMSWKEASPLLPLMPGLSLIQSFLAGVERIPRRDIPTGVALATGAGSNASAVAEHAMALLLALAKHLLFHDGRAREGCFSQLEAQGTDLRGKRALVLGYGHIGRRIGALCGAFGMEVTAMNRTGTSDADRTITPSGLLGALREADAVMVALAHTPSTDHQLGEEELACLKDTAMLVNVARGPVIDQGALYRRLASTPTLRAGLDVWWNYPRKGTPWRQEYHFEKLPNVLMTPHVAGLGETWRSDMMETAARNVLRFLQGEKIENRVDVDAYLM